MLSTNKRRLLRRVWLILVACAIIRMGWLLREERLPLLEQWVLYVSTVLYYLPGHNRDWCK